MKVFSKVSLPVSLAIALSVVAVAFFSNWYLKEQLFNEMYLERKDDALRSSKAILDAEMFRDPFSEESQEKFSRYMDSLRAGDVIRMTVWDTQGTVLASDLLSIVGQKAVRHPELYTVYETRRVVFVEKEFDNNDPLQTSISPVRIALIPLTPNGHYSGVVEIHMTNLIIGQTISRSVYSIAGLLLATGILLILAMIFLVRRVIIEPLRVISDASEKISQGDFDTAISVESKDEIGALAKVFVKMRGDLKQTISELKAKQDMEKRHVVELESVNQKVTAEKVRAEGILRYLKSIGEGVFATDRRGTIVFCNATAAAMVGRSIEELMGESGADIFHFCIGTDDEVCDFIPHSEAINKEKSFAFAPKTFLVEKDKHTPVSGTYSPIVEVDHIAGAIVVFQDITERYELEQMKDRFLSVAAHQLRTPLGSMRWTMELLEGGDLGKLPKQAVSAVQDLHHNSERMMNLVNDLLNVSRIDQATVKEVTEETDLKLVLAEVLQILTGEAEKKKIRFVVTQPKENLPKIAITRKHVLEAIENLVSNAIRYGKEGGEVKCVIAVKKDALTLSISDQGIGIPKEDQPKIFAKFFRASNAVKSFTDGSGLGLSVVKAYVEENGGTVTFESEENVGTTFTLSFPLGTITKEKEEPASEREVSAE